MSDEASQSLKEIRLRYADRCSACARELPVGSLAVHDRETKSVSCLACVTTANSEENSRVVVDQSTGSRGASDNSIPANSGVFAGVAGASARRKYERRKQGRETRIREDHPLVGGLLLAIRDDPQSTKAWATGAQGEERLGQHLDKLAGDRVHLLHDRGIPGSQANIDHIVVSSSGVFVIDAKKYKNGRPSLRVEGGLFRPRIEKLMVGSRDCTTLVNGVHKQVDRVRAALRSAELDRIPVAGMLCFVEADWPLLGGDFTIDRVRVLWPKKAATLIAQTGDIDAPTTQLIRQTLALAFPSA
ncbi:MAG: hypothetical protein JWN09_3034 [Microbacteriaceae bacterium]|nr:hypothetical protein [Microbacteriaceae bacterium]